MEWPFQLVRLQDEQKIEADTTLTWYRLVVFRLGNTGPYTERFKREEFTPQALEERVALLRSHLLQLPQ